MIILGNVIMADYSQCNNLNISNIDDTLISNLITISTNQDINSNVFVTEILATNIKAQVFNDLSQFAKNVVLLGDNSVVDCK